MNAVLGVTEIEVIMVKFKNIYGLTLIEIIVSIAILSIVAVSLFSLFTTGFITIVRAGDRTVDMFERQEDIENILSKKSNINGDGSFVIDLEGTDITPFGVQTKIKIDNVEIFYFHPRY